MIPTIHPRQSNLHRLVSFSPVKLTALLYLREALLAERYEECADFIAIAYEFGAREFEVSEILEDPRRFPFAARKSRGRPQ